MNIIIVQKCVYRLPIFYIKIFYWRASEASETLSGVYKFELVRYIL